MARATPEGTAAVAGRALHVWKRSVLAAVALRGSLAARLALGVGDKAGCRGLGGVGDRSLQLILGAVVDHHGCTGGIRKGWQVSEGGQALAMTGGRRHPGPPLLHAFLLPLALLIVSPATSSYRSWSSSVAG